VSRRSSPDWDEWSAERPAPSGGDGAITGSTAGFASAPYCRPCRANTCRAAFEARYGAGRSICRMATYMQTKRYALTVHRADGGLHGQPVRRVRPRFDLQSRELLKARGPFAKDRDPGLRAEIEKWRAYVRDRGLNTSTSPASCRATTCGRLRHAHGCVSRSAPRPATLSRCPSKTYSYAQARRPIIACRE